MRDHFQELPVSLREHLSEALDRGEPDGRLAPGDGHGARVPQVRSQVLLGAGRRRFRPGSWPPRRRSTRRCARSGCPTAPSRRPWVSRKARFATCSIPATPPRSAGWRKPLPASGSACWSPWNKPPDPAPKARRRHDVPDPEIQRARRRIPHGQTGGGMRTPATVSIGRRNAGVSPYGQPLIFAHASDHPEAETPPSTLRSRT